MAIATPPLPLAAGSADAISEHALLLLPQLRLLYSQRKEVRDRIEALLNRMTLLGSERSEWSIATWVYFSRCQDSATSSPRISSRRHQIRSPNGITMLSERIAGSRR